MDRIRQILFLDRHAGGFARPFACALEVARDHGAGLTLAVASGDRGDAVLHRRRRHRELGDRARVARGRGVEARVAALDRPLSSIVAEHDLVMAVAHRDTLRWPLRFAPEERDLLRRCGRPVWILHPVQGPKVRSIVAGVDVSEEGDAALNRRILRVAGSLAAGAGADLRVAHVWSLLGETLLRSPNRGGSRRRTRRILRGTAATRRQRLDRLLESTAVDAPDAVILRKGKAVQALEKIAWDADADLVVVGTSDRAGFGSLLFPAVAEQLLGRVPGSLLAVPCPVSSRQDRRAPARLSASTPVRRRAPAAPQPPSLHLHRGDR